MTADILGSGVAATVPEETRQWVRPALLQLAAEYVAFGHDDSMVERRKLSPG